MWYSDIIYLNDPSFSCWNLHRTCDRIKTTCHASHPYSKVRLDLPRFIDLADDMPEFELEPTSPVASHQSNNDPSATGASCCLSVQASSNAGCRLRAVSKNRRACKGQTISLILGFKRRSRHLSREDPSTKYSSTRIEEKSFILR